MYFSFRNNKKSPSGKVCTLILVKYHFISVIHCWKLWQRVGIFGQIQWFLFNFLHVYKKKIIFMALAGWIHIIGTNHKNANELCFFCYLNGMYAGWYVNCSPEWQKPSVWFFSLAFNFKQFKGFPLVFTHIFKPKMTEN